MIAEQVAAGLIRDAAIGRDERVAAVLQAAARWVESGARPSPTPQVWDAMDGVEVRDGI